MENVKQQKGEVEMDTQINSSNVFVKPLLASIFACFCIVGSLVGFSFGVFKLLSEMQLRMLSVRDFGPVFLGKFFDDNFYRYGLAENISSYFHYFLLLTPLFALTGCLLIGVIKKRFGLILLGFGYALFFVNYFYRFGITKIVEITLENIWVLHIGSYVYLTFIIFIIPLIFIVGFITSGLNSKRKNSIVVISFLLQVILIGIALVIPYVLTLLGAEKGNNFLVTSLISSFFLALISYLLIGILILVEARKIDPKKKNLYSLLGIGAVVFAMVFVLINSFSIFSSAEDFFRYGYLKKDYRFKNKYKDNMDETTRETKEKFEKVGDLKIYRAEIEKPDSIFNNEFYLSLIYSTTDEISPRSKETIWHFPKIEASWDEANETVKKKIQTSSKYIIDQEITDSSIKLRLDEANNDGKVIEYVECKRIDDKASCFIVASRNNELINHFLENRYK